MLLYAHYDVVPAGDESLWTTPPFEPAERDGAIFGRGSSDCKANVIAHVGALRAWDGRPPVGVKILIEGQEEIGGGSLNAYPQSNPDVFRADAMLISDMGSVRPGVPTLTIGLRGMAQVRLQATTLAGAKHSGQYGGAAPDALLAVLRALASLHDEHGDVAVPGLLREPWTGVTFDDAEFRALAEVEPGVPLLGTGDLGSRLWSGPAITVTGIDVPSVDNALNAVSPYARRLAERPRASRAGPGRGPGSGDRAPRGTCDRSGSSSRSRPERPGRASRRVRPARPTPPSVRRWSGPGELRR